MLAQLLPQARCGSLPAKCSVLVCPGLPTPELEGNAQRLSQHTSCILLRRLGRMYSELARQVV